MVEKLKRDCMNPIIINTIQDREEKSAQYYVSIAHEMMDILGTEEYPVVLEAGCGAGTLTLPLHSQIQGNALYICYDLFSGCYASCLAQLRKKNEKWSIIRGDARTMSIHSESVDVVISHELLCELTEEDTLATLKEVYRILVSGGLYINGVLSPYPENRAQELVVLADAHSDDPLFKKEWFSPPADTLASMLHLTGFTTIRVRYIDESIRFENECAFQQLEEWKTDLEFYQSYFKEVKIHGLELPPIQMISCYK
jgi:ubiquinone/menaquinone biosynthesis C-methylase UbiE